MTKTQAEWPEVQKLLSDYAAKVTTAIVEVGSYRGRTATYLAQGNSEVPIYAVEPHNLEGNVAHEGNEAGPWGYNTSETQKAFLERIKPFPNIIYVQKLSKDAAEGYDGPPVGLLHLDGDHSYRGVKTDLESWTPHLADGAYVLFDDYDTYPGHAGVKQAVDEHEETFGPYTFFTHPERNWDRKYVIGRLEATRSG